MKWCGGKMKPFIRVQAEIAIAAILVIGAKALSAEDNIWTRIGPEGGNIQRLLVDPQDPDTLYALAGGAIFKTANGASTWSLTISGLPSARVNALAIDPRKSGILYALTSAGG